MFDLMRRRSKQYKKEKKRYKTTEQYVRLKICEWRIYSNTSGNLISFNDHRTSFIRSKSELLRCVWRDVVKLSIRDMQQFRGRWDATTTRVKSIQALADVDGRSSRWHHLAFVVLPHPADCFQILQLRIRMHTWSPFFRWLKLRR